MRSLTWLALHRPSVTVLVMLLILVGGVITYRSLERELFPDIEFPTLVIFTVFPSANPETVEREVTKPIEEAIEGMTGLEEIQSTSSENLSFVLATFEFGEDLVEAERAIEGNLNGIRFPDDVEDPVVQPFFNNDVAPVLQLSVTGDRDIPSMQRLMDDLIIPRIERVPGVLRADVVGGVKEQAVITVDSEKLEDLGISIAQVAGAVRDNNTSFAAGDIDASGSSFPVRTTHEFGSLDDIRNLNVGFERPGLVGGVLPNAPIGSLRGARPVRLSEVAEVSLSTAEATSISRTNSRPSLNVVVLKETNANTVDVTEGVLGSLEAVDELPPDMEIIVLSNDGPEVKEQLNKLLQEGLLGFFFAVVVVFVFLINLRPTVIRGLTLTLRPTVIIGISIPLSVLTGIMVMALYGLSLNFMSLAGLAIAVGRVVDDSIVVLENIYRHIQRGEDRMQAALDATREVGAAIVSSTATTVVVFVPLAFIQGLVGEFFTPFALSVSFALVASTLVALTAVPVLGAMLLRRGDFPLDGDAGTAPRETLMQRIYMPVLRWALGHKAPALLIAIVTTVASLGLTLVVPVTLFPSGAPQFLTINVELPTGASVSRAFAEVVKVEEVLERYKNQGIVEAYQVSLGSGANEFGPGFESGGFHKSGFFVKLHEGAPEGIAEEIRSQLPGGGDVTITVAEIGAGPPSDGLEINITGSDFTTVSAVAKRLEAELATIEGVINLKSDITETRQEVSIHVDPRQAGELGLSTAAVAQQVNQFIVGQKVGEVDLEGVTMDIVVRGHPEDVDHIEKLRALDIEGPLGRVKLGSISDIVIEDGPLTISRFDGERSAGITGNIVAADTRAVGAQVAARIASLDLPPGVEIRTGGIFQQIAEGFAQIFAAMAVGVVLVYLVMVASLGSLRNPLVIVLSLPLAIVGALVALAVTDRTLSMSALMGLLLLIGVVVTNAIVLITFVEQLREQGAGVYDALIESGRVRLRPILMTAFTTTFALLPLAFSSADDGGIVGAELATVVIGGLVSSTFLTLIVVPVLYTLFHVSLPGLIEGTVNRILRPSHQGSELAPGETGV